MFDVQKTLYSAVQYSLIINILFLNLTTMPLGEGIKNIVPSLFDTIEYIYFRRNDKTFYGRSGIALCLIKSKLTNNDSLNCPLILFSDVGHDLTGENLPCRKTARL